MQMVSPQYQEIARRTEEEETVLSALETYLGDRSNLVLRNPRRFRMHQKDIKVLSQRAFERRRMQAIRRYDMLLVEGKVVDPEAGHACLCYNCRALF